MGNIKKPNRQKISAFKESINAGRSKVIDSIIDQYSKAGYSPMHIAGILGNGSQESRFNPDTIGPGGFKGVFQISKDIANTVKRIYGSASLKNLNRFIIDANAGKKHIPTEWKNYMQDNGGFYKNKYANAGDAAIAFGKSFERPNEKYANWESRKRSAEDALAYVNDYLFKLKVKDSRKALEKPYNAPIDFERDRVKVPMRPVEKYAPIEQQPAPTVPINTQYKDAFRNYMKIASDIYNSEDDNSAKFFNRGKNSDFSVKSLVHSIYENNPKEKILELPVRDYAQSEEWADAHGYYADAKGHRDDRVKKPAHPSHPSRGTWYGDKFELTEKGMDDPNYIMFGLTDGDQDPNAILTYKNGVVLPEFTVTPNGNYIYNSYDNIKLYYPKNKQNKFNGGKSIKPNNSVLSRIANLYFT